MNNKHCVYVHTNRINGKKYIGITNQYTSQRWRNNGIGYKSTPHFWSSIQKYGWNNFDHDIIYDKLSEQEAKRIEIELISKYKTTDNQYGYNISTGGDGACGVKRTTEQISNLRSYIIKSVVRFDKDNIENYIIFDSLSNASKETNVDSKHISRCCLKQRKSTGNYYWMFYDEYIKNGFDISIAESNKNKKVLCVSTGELFDTIKEASIKYGVTSAAILNCCKGKTLSSAKLKWSYSI